MLKQAPDTKPFDPTVGLPPLEGTVPEVTVTPEDAVDNNDNLNLEEENLNTTPIEDNIKVEESYEQVTEQIIK